MNESKPTYIPCQACRGLSYSVLYDHRANVAHVLCADCNRELFAASMAPPEELRVPPI